MTETQHTIWHPGGSCPACGSLIVTSGRSTWCTQASCDWTDPQANDPILMPLTEKQKAYAAAYQTALVEGSKTPASGAFGVSHGQAKMIENRVERGTVDYDELPEMLRPPELDTE
jgi:hypothetical protein